MTLPEQFLCRVSEINAPAKVYKAGKQCLAYVQPTPLIALSNKKITRSRLPLVVKTWPIDCRTIYLQQPCFKDNELGGKIDKRMIPRQQESESVFFFILNTGIQTSKKRSYIATPNPTDELHLLACSSVSPKLLTQCGIFHFSLLEFTFQISVSHVIFGCDCEYWQVIAELTCYEWQNGNSRIQ